MRAWFVKVLSLSFIFLSSMSLIGQISNNDCSSAMPIADATNFCGQFSNRGATPSMDGLANSCWSEDIGNQDVWFRFIARREGALIRLFGRSPINRDWIVGLGIQVFEGNCGDLTELSCFPNIASTRVNELEIYLKDLEIGEPYLIRVDAFSEDQGDFNLCIRSFSPRLSPEQDCPDAIILCNTENLAVEFLPNAGVDEDEADGTCLKVEPFNSETNSVWYVFECMNPGELVFVITPNNDNNPEEDIDFILYELPNGIGDCTDKINIRCMASGITLDNSQAQNAPCLEQTGLRFGENDIVEFPGCDSGDNNFIAPATLTSGTAYALLVNNFSESNFGFTLDFDGTTATFVGPKAEFETDRSQLFCDQEITFSDLSQEGNDGAISYTWKFGEESVPMYRSNTSGPHTIRYESFGPKFISLTVRSPNGCQSVDILELDVGTCCDPAVNSLSGELSGTNIDCAGESTGTIETTVTDPGWGGVRIAFEDGNYSSISNFNTLPAGDYNVTLQDKKGCEFPIPISLTERPPIVIDAGDPQTIDLGSSTFLDADVDISIYDPDLSWSFPEFIDCDTCPFTEVTPVVTTTFTLTATNEFDCIVRDEVEISVIVDYDGQVYRPDIFTPNGDGNNDFFKLYGGQAVDLINQLKIYNRWGDLVYVGQNLSKGDNDFSEGWDGTFNGQKLDPDVYTWVAEVLYLDSETKTLKGSMTLLR